MHVFASDVSRAPIVACYVALPIIVRIWSTSSGGNRARPDVGADFVLPEPDEHPGEGIETLLVGALDLRQDFRRLNGPAPEGEFLLFRIGDALSARNAHAAIYDALRLLKDV